MQNNKQTNENVSRVVSEFFKKKTASPSDRYNKNHKPSSFKKPYPPKKADGDTASKDNSSPSKAPAESSKQGNQHSNNNHRYNKNRRPYHKDHKNKKPESVTEENLALPTDEAIAESVTEVSDEIKTADVTAEKPVQQSEPTVNKEQQNESSEWYDPEKLVEIIGIRFQSGTKTYYFAPNGFTVQKGDNVIVETARGLEFGTVQVSNSEVKVSEVVLPLKNVIRIATEDDVKKLEENNKKVAEALKICNERIAFHKLDMKLVDVEYTFDNSKLLFYFTSDCRVDFRELVKDLASIFKTRIELRQIGIREETKLLGGIGICGLPFCCKSFLTDFVQVSIKMAKEQGLSLNSAKISGACGRLMCCLRYEYDTYDEEIRKTPKNDTPVMTPDGPGVVCETQPLAGLCKVKMDDAGETVIKVYHRDDLKRIEK